MAAKKRAGSAYKISEVARRAGCSPATLRYYEELGLVRPTHRSDAGYRLYDEGAIERLAFIARAKQLGCTLEEIAELVIAADGGRCGPIQEQLRVLVTAKLDATQRQIAELVTFADQLREASSALESHRPDGPCDERCGCISAVDTSASTTTVTSRPVTLTTKATPLRDPVAIACTATAVDVERQLTGWQSLMTHVAQRHPINGGLRVTFASSVPMAQLIELTTQEQQCCQFFDFAITVDRRGLALEVRAPDEAVSLVHSLFGVDQ
jgi:MerR family transcriptional regulator, copper efflux regulator